MTKHDDHDKLAEEIMRSLAAGIDVSFENYKRCGGMIEVMAVDFRNLNTYKAVQCVMLEDLYDTFPSVTAGLAHAVKCVTDELIKERPNAS